MFGNSTIRHCESLYSRQSNLIILLLFFSFSLSAQFNRNEYVEILQADELSSDQPGVQNLIGHVKLKQGSLLLNCDKARIEDKTNDFTAEGRVYMNKKDSLRIYCDRMNYIAAKKLTIFSGNVKMISDKTTLTTDLLYYENESGKVYYQNKAHIIQEKTKIWSDKGYYVAAKKMISLKSNVVVKSEDFSIMSDTLDYHTGTKVTYFHGPSRITTKTGIITCEKGYFDNIKDEAVFKKNAKVIDKTMILTADSIYRNNKTKISHAHGNVRATDTTDNVTITGEHGIFIEKGGKSLMTGKALLEQMIDGDTLFLHADTLRAVNDEKKKDKKVYAYHHVKFLKSDMQGKCDSLTYFPSDSLIRLFKNPIIWTNKSQISGEYIEILLYSNKIHELRIKKNGFIISENGPGAYDQIKGRDMVGYFENSKMSKMKVTGNGETVYFAKEKDSSYTGVNKAECSSLMILFKDNQVSRIKFYQKPDATFYPIHEVDLEKMKLKNFMWRIEEKPNSIEDLFK